MATTGRTTPGRGEKAAAKDGGKGGAESKTDGKNRRRAARRHLIDGDRPYPSPISATLGAEEDDEDLGWECELYSDASSAIVA